MPRLNSRGDVVCGVGGPIWGRGAGTQDTVIYADRGTCAQWLNDGTLIGNVADVGWLVAVCSAWKPKEWAPYWDHGCNWLAAGGGLWQAHLADPPRCYGEYGEQVGFGVGLTDNDGRSHAGPSGEINIIPVAGVGIQIHSRSHGIYNIPFGPAREVQVLGPTAALWRDDAGKFYTSVIPAPAQASPGGSPKYCQLPDGHSWIVYYSNSYGLIAHPWENAAAGVLLAGPGHNAFYPDAKISSVTGKLVAAWSTGAGELPGELAIQPDVLSLPRTGFGLPPTVDIVPITYPCWAGFFVGGPTSPPHWQTSTDPASVPGNCYLLIEDDADGAQVKRDTGEVVGDYVTGTVEHIEQAAAAIATQGRIPFCYYDAPEWPYTPGLPATAIILHQAYHASGETAEAFRGRVGQQIERFHAYQNGLCAQCFTSNNSLTKDLASVASSVSALAQRFPLVAVMGFSGSGRGTGLQDHPEVRPLWDQLYAQVPGTPGTPTGGSMDWGTIDRVGRDRWREMEVNRKSQELVDQGLECREFQKDCFVKITSELYYDHHIPLELFWKAGVPEYGNPQDVKDKLKYIGEDIIVDRAASGYKDSVSAMGHPSAAWNAGGGLAPVTGGDLNRCSRPPDLGGAEPEPPEPPTGEIGVFIYSYDRTTRRSNPEGCLVRFEAASDRPIVEITLDLEGDVAAPIVTSFQVGPGFDGRYIRGLAFKPTENGDYVLRVTAKDDAGRTGAFRRVTSRDRDTIGDTMLRLLIIIIVVGMALWVVEQYMPMSPPIKMLLRGVAILFLLLLLLQFFGIAF